MVFVFKTSVSSRDEVLKVGPSLSNCLSSSGSWHFDLEDCDRILRVETNQHVQPAELISLLKSEGFDCEELSD